MKIIDKIKKKIYNKLHPYRYYKRPYRICNPNKYCCVPLILFLLMFIFRENVFMILVLSILLLIWAILFIPFLYINTRTRPEEIEAKALNENHKQKNMKKKVAETDKEKDLLLKGKNSNYKLIFQVVRVLSIIPFVILAVVGILLIILNGLIGLLITIGVILPMYLVAIITFIKAHRRKENNT